MRRDEQNPNEEGEYNEIYNNLFSILKKGDEVTRKKSRKKLLDIINTFEDDKGDEEDKKHEEHYNDNIVIFDDNQNEIKSSLNSEGNQSIKIKERTLYKLKVIFERIDLKGKYFKIWKEGGSQLRVSQRIHRKSIKRVVFKKKGDNKKNIESKTGQNIGEGNQEIEEICDSVIKILKKGDDVKRRESKKKLLDILNSIEENVAEENKEVKDEKIEDEKIKKETNEQSLEKQNEKNENEVYTEFSKKLSKKTYELMKNIFEMKFVKKK